MRVLLWVALFVAGWLSGAAVRWYGARRRASAMDADQQRATDALQQFHDAVRSLKATTDLVRVAHNAPVPQLAHVSPADGSVRYWVGWKRDGEDHALYEGDDSDAAVTAWMELEHAPHLHVGAESALSEFWDGDLVRGSLDRRPVPAEPT